MSQHDSKHVRNESHSNLGINKKLQKYLGACEVFINDSSFLVQQGRIQSFWKGVALYVGHHGWPAKKILGFKWSKKAEITAKTTSFWQNISISVFKFSPFLSRKSYQFFKIY